MEQKYGKLFEPAIIGSTRLKNRIVMAPMGMTGYSDYQGGFTENARNYYVERAKGGAGLLITGGCAVDYREAQDFVIPCVTYNPMVFRMSATLMIEKVHAYDSKIFIQLTGGLGRSALPGYLKDGAAPSQMENRFEPGIIHREMTAADLEELKSNFIKSAVIAQKAGFDGVEINGIHEGCMLDQFALSLFNHRTDEYGGDLSGRLKLSVDIVKGIKKACGADFPISFRFSFQSMMKGPRQGAVPGESFEEAGRDVAEGLAVAKILEEAGCDALNVDAGSCDSWYWNHPPLYFEEGMYRRFGKLVKQAVDIPVILSGRMDDPEVAIDGLNGCCDLVAYGRPLLADPYLPQKLRTEHYADIRPCLSCHQGCMGRVIQGLPLSCAVNPACGQEISYGIEPAAVKKKILIVGAGLAGMECARVCALRGHQVALWEKGSRMGGSVISGGAPDFKVNERKLLAWYEKQIQDLGIRLMLNCAAGPDEVRNSDADVVVIATGARPTRPELGIKNHICMAQDIVSGRTKAGDRVVIVGGGQAGCETAYWLAQQGKAVSVVEMQHSIMGGPYGMPFMNYDMLRDLMAFYGVKIYRSTKLEGVEDNEVVLQSPDGELRIPADTVVLAMGYQPDSYLYDSLQFINKPVYSIGDSRKVKNILAAVWNAYELARNL